MRVDEGTPKPVIHLTLISVLICSLLSFVATPANAIALPECTPEISTSGGYTIVKFVDPGECTWTSPTDTAVMRGLIVGGGGGGGGGSFAGGGGGGGGYVSFETLTVTNKTLTISVGAGGAPASPGGFGPNADASNGGNSTLTGDGLNIIALGGGSGGSLTNPAWPNFMAKSGGSGGGSNASQFGRSETTTNLSFFGQSAEAIGLMQRGHNGSPKCEPADGPFAAGGGGGAGGPATCAPVTNAGYSSFSGNGGVGFQNNILGANHFWAGGGGGSNFVFSYDGNQPSFDGGDGGSGGGGGGGTSYEGSVIRPISSGVDDTNGLNPATRAGNAGFGVGGNGGVNTGGGGGAGSHGGNGGLGGNGGSGIVVLKYASTSWLAISRPSVGSERLAAFTVQPQITIQSGPNNETVTSSAAVVTATISSGGTLLGTATATAQSGIATFSNLAVNGTVGTRYRITYSSPGISPVTEWITITPAKISLAAVGGVTAPASGATPVATITSSSEFTGTVSWAETLTVSGNFAANSTYTATITLTAATGYSLSAVTANFFTVAGATSATNLAGSGVITAVFPVTGGKATPTFSAWSNVSKTYGDASFTVTEPTVTGSVAGTFSYSSATTSVISVSGTTLTVEGAGSSVITATFTPTDLASHNIATTTMTVTVAKASRTVSIDPASYETIYRDPINDLSIYYTYAMGTFELGNTSPTLPTITATASAGTGTLSYAFYGWNSCIQVRGQVPGKVTTHPRYMSYATCGVRASIGPDANYLQATSAMVYFYFVPRRTFTVTYSPNSAGGSAERISETYQQGRTPISLPGVGTMVKTGFTLQGWSESGSTPVISGAYTPTGNVTLKAVWSPAAYTFSFSANGGIDTPTSISGTIGDSLILPVPITRPPSGGISYQFAGWKSGDSIYESGDTIRVGSSDLTFTAQWVRQYEVTYLANGGVFATGETEKDSQCISNICNANQVITLNLSPTRLGYTFGGWEAPGGISVSDIDTGTAGIQTAVTDSNYLFSANWTPIQYPINYISSGSTAPTQSTLTAGETFNVGAAVTRDDYTFDGWSDGAATYWPDSTYVVGTSAISLTAQWIYDLNPYDGTNGRVTCSVAGNFTISENSVTAATNCQGAVVIPNGVTSLAVDLFKDNSSITSLTIPNTVLSIGTDAFTNTTALTSFTYCGSDLIEGDFTNAGLESKTKICAVSNSVNTQNSPSPSVAPAPTPTPNVISSADIARAKAAEKKADLEKLQLKVAQNQKNYLEPFPSLTTSEASTPSLIPDPKSGMSLNTSTETINSSQSASVKIPARNLSLSRVVMDELKSRVRIMITTTGISVTPVNGFTGLIVVPVIGVVDGVETLVLNKVVVNPTPPKVQSFGPTSIKQSSIAWAPSTSQIIGYRVMVNGNEICQTTANTCPVAELIGPKSVVTITSLGNDQTVSTPVVIPYAATRPIPALKVNFAVGSSLLSQAQKREIQSIAKVIDTQGFSRIVVSGFTDSSGSASLNRKLSEDRAKSVAAFMRTLLPNISIKASAFGPAKPIASNGSVSGKAQNRRTEIATW
jgi:outer membrane protein OmpA-like peptidoglycan-associated protein